MKRMVKKLSAGVSVLALLAGCASPPKQPAGNTPAENTQQSTGVNRAADQTYLTTAVPAAAPARRTTRNVPDFVRTAMQGAPKDELVGVGMAVSKDLSTEQSAMEQAESRARASISRQLQTVVQNRIVDHRRTSEADPAAVISYQETTIKTLSESRLLGAKVVDAEFDDSSRYWVIVRMSTAEGAQEIKRASSAAAIGKLQPARLATLESIEEMEKDLAKVREEPVEIVDDATR